MTAAVASVPTLGLPFAVSLLGWGGGLVALVCGGAVTMFTSFLVSSMLEYGGTRHIRFRDLAVAVFGACPTPLSLPSLFLPINDVLAQLS